MKTNKQILLSGIVLCGMSYGCVEKTTIKNEIMFDDFSYTSASEFSKNGWKVRTQIGHPGVKKATWSRDGLSFHTASEGAKNGMVRLTSFTDGTAENTQHTQFCHARKYREGTYAARVYFRDAPSKGPDGDEVIQTFYAISPLKAPMDTDYSEADFEYLPNGGWGGEELTLWSTSWETFQLEPWTKDNEYSTIVGSLNGWHTLVLQIANDSLTYFVDGNQFSKHSVHVYPEVPMSINFNMWFTPEGLIESNKIREYQEDVDWVYFEKNAVLSPVEIEKKIAAMRLSKTRFVDTVNEFTPTLASPCGL